MSGSHGRLSRDLIGNDLYIKGKLVIDDEANIDAKTGTFRKGLKVNGGVTFPTDQILEVPSAKYPTIQSAIDALNGTFANKTTIQIAPGIYNEFIHIDNLSSNPSSIARQNPPIDNTIVEDPFPDTGLQILGDTRPYLPCTTYINGYEFAGSASRGTLYHITTSSPSTGPYIAQLSPSFGGIGNVGPVGIQIANPLIANSNLIGFTSGNIALIKRGSVAFATKAENAQNAGAVAAIIYNSVSPGIAALGGRSSTVTIPTYSISLNDGNTLTTLINNNPGIQITITAVDPLYYPPLGTNFAIPQLSLDVTRTILTITMNGPLPVADPSILAPPVLVQPDFTHPAIGLVAGDRLILSDSSLEGNFARSIHTVVSVNNGNQITITPAVPDVGDGGVDVTVVGANVTFLPNVCISPIIADSLQKTLISIQSSVSMTGIHVDQNALSPLSSGGNAFFVGRSTALLCNCVATDVYSVSVGYGMEIADSTVYTLDGNTGHNGAISMIGYGRGIFTQGSASVRANNVFLGGMKQDAITLASKADFSVNSLQIMGSGGLFIADTHAGVNIGGTPNTSNYSGTSMSINQLCHIADIYGTGINMFGGTFTSLSPCVRIERCFYPQGFSNVTGCGISLRAGSKFAIGDGVYYATGQFLSQLRLSATVTDCFDIFGAPFTYPNVGIFVDATSEFNSACPIVYNNNDLNYQVVQGGKFSVSNNVFTTISSGSATVTLPTGTINVESTVGFSASGGIIVITNLGPQVVHYTGVTASSFTGCTGGSGIMGLGFPVTQSTSNQILQYSATGSVVMDAVYTQQLINASGATNLTLDPSAIFGLDYLYIGKTYTVTSSNTQANTLTLPGAYFVVYGASNATTASFNTVNAQSFITFRVESINKVRVLSSAGMSFA